MSDVHNFIFRIDVIEKQVFAVSNHDAKCFVLFGNLSSNLLIRIKATFRKCLKNFNAFKEKLTGFQSSIRTQQNILNIVFDTFDLNKNRLWDIDSVSIQVAPPPFLQW